MEDRLQIYMEEPGPSFVGGVVNTMTAELQNQVSHLAKAHASTDRKIDRLRAALSELDERVRAAPATKSARTSGQNSSISCGRRPRGWTARQYNNYVRMRLPDQATEHQGERGRTARITGRNTSS